MRLISISSLSRFYNVKDTNLKAILNLALIGVQPTDVGFTMSKIQIWKQFSTMVAKCSTAKTSVLQCQRYKFESNSQLGVDRCPTNRRRFYNVKDTNLKAILNNGRKVFYGKDVGFTMSKIQIWKQFSTPCPRDVGNYKSVLQCQRYKFESNSQREMLNYLTTLRRFYNVKDTNLKAILNWQCASRWTPLVGFTMSKIQIWKQFSTHSWPACKVQ